MGVAARNQREKSNAVTQCMESMLASEAEYQLADTFDTMRSLSDSLPAITPSHKQIRSDGGNGDLCLGRRGRREERKGDDHRDYTLTFESCRFACKGESEERRAQPSVRSGVA